MLEGVALGLVFSGMVAVLTFVAHHRLPYKRMLVAHGSATGIVLLVMVGESIQEMHSQAGFPHTRWVSRSRVGRVLVCIVPTVEGVSRRPWAVLLIGSYFLAEHLRVRRPSARAEREQHVQLDALVAVS